MPYPFAHPAAILPLVRPMGRFAVPSALAIGCMIPDAWYFAPLVGRDDSHSLGGLLWFCLPAGVLAYLAFHFLLKQPLVALLPRALASRLVPLAPSGLPPARWDAVLVSLLVGAFTHFAWDGLTHDQYIVNGFQVLQHASTLLGAACVAGWAWRRLKDLPAQPLPRAFALSPAARCGTLLLLITLSISWALAGAEGPGVPRSVDELREALRTTGMTGVQALALSTIGYAMLWKLLR